MSRAETFWCGLAAGLVWLVIITVGLAALAGFLYGAAYVVRAGWQAAA